MFSLHWYKNYVSNFLKANYLTTMGTISGRMGALLSFSYFKKIPQTGA